MSGTAQDHVIEHAVEMCEGNPGAITALKELHNATGDPFATLSLMKYLKDNKITGPLIWLCYKDVCKFDASDMIKRIGVDHMASDLEKLPYSQYKRPKA